MRPFEAVVIGYLAFFSVAALFSPVASRTRVSVALSAVSMAAAIYIVARVFPLEVRLCLPFLYIAIGYWIPVPLVPPARGGAFEAWLRHTDMAVRRTAMSPFRLQPPSARPRSGPRLMSCSAWSPRPWQSAQSSAAITTSRMSSSAL
jgi:hypothetical protein